MSTPDTTHALYVLLDSNLPTGGFVASSGLESYAKHGFLSPSRAYGISGIPDIKGSRGAPGREWISSGSGSAGKPSHAAPKSAAPLGPSRAGPAIAQFASAEVDNFEASTGWYLAQSWGVAARALSCSLQKGVNMQEEGTMQEGRRGGNAMDDGLGSAIAALVALDNAHEATLLSHVARRASRAQGVALLTLHARGLGPPPGFSQGEEEREGRAHELVAGYKRAVRRGAPGHLAVCFGAVTAALGMDLGECCVLLPLYCPPSSPDTAHPLTAETARHLYLFTHARSLLSSAVRLNIVGPYLSTQLLSHPLRQTISHSLASDATRPPDGGAHDAGDGWGWADEAEQGPATTWPLGEILAARHDLQHSRIFNS